MNTGITKEWLVNDGTGFGIRDLPVGPLQQDPTWV